jgi:hypothetical protein
MLHKFKKKSENISKNRLLNKANPSKHGIKTKLAVSPKREYKIDIEELDNSSFDPFKPRKEIPKELPPMQKLLHSKVEHLR